MEHPNRIQGKSTELVGKQTVFQLVEYHASQQPEKEAIALYDQDWKRFSLTFGDWHTKSQTLAKGLLEKGLGNSETVAYISSNNLKYPIDVMALYKTGANVITVEQGFDAESLLKVIRKVQCSVLMYHMDSKHPSQTRIMQEVTKLLLQESDYLKAVILSGSEAVYGELPSRVYFYSDLISCGQSLRNSRLQEVQARVRLQDRALVQLTTGSTGVPKAVQLSHLSLVLAAFGTACMLGVNNTSRVFTDATFNWCSAMWAGINLVACTGASLVSVHPTPTVSKRSIELTLKVLQDEKCSAASLKPLVIYHINAFGPLVNNYNRDCLQSAFTGSQPVPTDILRKLMSLLPNLKACLAYGSTETSLVACQKLDKDSLDKQTYGWMEMFADVELNIRDDEGRAMPSGTIGEVNIRSPFNFTEYFRDPTSTLQNLTSDGWFKTGDAGMVDENGRLKIVGRKKNIIKRASIAYYPPDIEEFITAHSQVASTVVVGVPDQRLFEEICACVVLKEGENKETVLTSLERFYNEQVPSDATGLPLKPGYTVVMDQFPLNKRGKLDRIKIREMAMEILGIKDEH